MIAALIRWSIANRSLVLLAALMVAGAGIHAARQTPVDAIPDLSDTQVIIRTTWPGQAPRVVEDQVTYPLTSALLAVPGARTVRGFSAYGDSFVYVLFDDGTDPYWARSRVLEYLSQLQGRLPRGVTPLLGPDASGVGWVYEYALVDRTGQHDLADLRALQDWLLRYELGSVEGVAEVATVGGMTRQYQVVVHPDRLRAFGITLEAVERAIQRANGEASGATLELAEAEYMVRATGYLTGLEDLAAVPVGVDARGTPIMLDRVADLRIGPALRRGIAELDGEGEVVGGIVIMRQGANAQQVIRAVEARLTELAASLPAGVEVVETYDRSSLIQRAVDNLNTKLIEELIVVALVCFAFLLHVRSSLVVVISLPLGILAALAIMRWQGLSANVMSLGGIAIAIGTMVDASIVMIENVHKHLEAQPDRPRWEVVAEASSEVGPSLFFSLLIVAVSFLPVFTLEAQEGRLFAPLAWTKTWAMVSGAVLSVTLVPVLIGLFVRGPIAPEDHNPINRAFRAVYRPLLEAALARPRLVSVGALVLVLATAWPLSRLGTEFMPELDEGDLLYMPTTLPGIAPGAAADLLQRTDRMIASVPEVEHVFGKAGSAETATDPAPLSMLETTIRLKPRDEWREGVTTESLKQELAGLLDLPGLANAIVMPIKTRIDMLATGVKTPVGVKVSGPDLDTLSEIATEVERVVAAVPGATGVLAERVSAGRYVEVAVRRQAAARHGLSVADVQEVVAMAVGGRDVTFTVEGRERYPVNLRYPQSVRDSVERLRELPVVTMAGARVALGELADIRIAAGPAEIKSEDARPTTWVYVDITGRDLGSFVAEARARVAAEVSLPAGYAIGWTGQFEYLERAEARLSVIAPLALALIVVMLFMAFRRWLPVLIVLGALPFALVGGVWLLWALDYQLSVAVIVGFIALAGVAAETGVVMLVYLDQAWERRRAAGRADLAALREAIEEGALQRLRPKLMTVTSIIVGLLPIMWGTGTGSEVMRRIAAPMVGGMVSATLLTLVVIPVLFELAHGRALRRA